MPLPDRRHGHGLYSLLPFLLFLTVLFLLPATAPAVRLTFAEHLFDISEQFRQPSDVAVSPDGLIYVVDGVHNEIKVFDSSGSFKFSFGKKGSAPGRFMFPLGIHVDRAGTVYVADSGNHRVQVFSRDGRFLNQLSLQQGRQKEADPTDVAVDSDRGRIYITDNDNHSILVHDLSSLAPLRQYGGPGEEKRQFRYPFLMTLDSQGYLYIVDVINTRVQVLNPEGLFTAFIGGWGVEAGEFYRPKGVAMDSRNRVYVSDSYMGVIQVFQSTGEFHSVLGNPADGSVRKFRTPTGIYIDGRDRLYVAEMFAEKISVFQITSGRD